MADEESAQSGHPSRTRAVLSARLAAAESRLDAAASAKSVKELREAIVASIEILRGETPVAQDD